MLLLAWLAFAVAGFSIAEAHQRDNIPMVGFLQRRVEPSLANPDPLASAFRQGLRELGYVEGKNIQIEHRYAGGKSDRLKDLLNELVQRKVAVIVIPSSQVLQIAKQLTTTVPIVMVTPNDPVRSGLVKSLAQPGGNITGITRLTRDLSGKRFEILREAVPGISRIGILSGRSTTALADFDTAARAANVSLQLIEMSNENPDLEKLFAAAVKNRMNGLITVRDAVRAITLGASPNSRLSIGFLL